MFLDQKEEDQDDAGKGHDILSGRIGGQIQSFNGGQHRNCGSDHPVTIKQGGPGGSQNCEKSPGLLVVF